VNPLLVKSIFLLLTFKKELKYVLFTFILILLLPIIAVFVVTHTGIQVVANKLVSINVNNHKIEIYDPTGKLVSEIHTYTTWPIHGVVTLEFGESDFPYQILHTGIDIAGNIGDPITPFMKGKVIYAGDISWGYGKHVIIDNADHITSLYGHMNSISVKVGDEVKPGDVVGTRGSTGWSTGPHTHFEIDVFGVPVNPRTFVLGNP
jgi:murein DD-endopeptidase MepM/ murein hydrolase activator NlpD